MARTKPGHVPTWKASPVVERLEMSRNMLHIHGVITDLEHQKITRRILKLKDKKELQR